MWKRLVFGVLCAVIAASAHAADFYAGKQIDLIVSSGTIGSYGDIAFAISRYMPKYIPGSPSIVVQGMPGAGNVLATNYLFNIAPKDGTVIGLINNAIPLHQVLDGRGVHYDASKFNWLGSTGSYNSATYAWRASGIRTLQDAMNRKVILGGTGVGSSIVMYPMVMNNILGTKFDIVTGYRLTTDIDLAMVRGEVQARSGSWAALKVEHPDWIRDRKIVSLVQVGPKKDPEIGDVPLMADLGKTPEDRAVLSLVSTPIALGRPFLAPPGVPPARIGLLRNALQATFRDPDFLRDMKKSQMEIIPTTGDDLERVIQETVFAPPAIIAKAKVAMGELTKGN